ncbi:MAG TPA: hypothetical protein VND64_18605 [Pirellulales bacterium]|nr:hypothetical protein [Pirellulales bacterium]
MVDSDRESRDQHPSGSKSEMVVRVCDFVVGLFAMALIVEVVRDGRADEPKTSLPRFTISANRFGKGFELVSFDVIGNNVKRVETLPGGAADPCWSRDGRRLLFTSAATGRSQIYVLDAVGGKPMNLTNSANQEFQPCWSPDGTKVVFTSSRDGNHEVYVMDADGAGPLNLTRNAAFDSDPAWSPNGKRILFGSNRQDGIRLYVIDADGGNVHQLVDRDLGGWVNAAWSPDGRQVLFGGAQADGTRQIFVADADNGQGVEPLTEGAGFNGYPSWSEDGQYIAYVHFDRRFDQSPEGGKLMVLNLDTLTHTEIAPEGMRFGASRIAWLPSSN